MLGVKEESLNTGSRRWLLFDPLERWIQNSKAEYSPSAANQPWQGKEIIGKVVASGLKS